MDHHLTELVNVVESALCEDGMHETSGGEIEPSH